MWLLQLCCGQRSFGLQANWEPGAIPLWYLSVFSGSSIVSTSACARSLHVLKILLSAGLPGEIGAAGGSKTASLNMVVKTAPTSGPVPSTMKAWQYRNARGALEKNLHFNHAAALPPLPVPGSEDVLIEVISMALNPADYKLPELPLLGRLLISKPASPCLDFCGRVVSCAEGACRFAGAAPDRIGETRAGTGRRIPARWFAVTASDRAADVDPPIFRASARRAMSAGFLFADLPFLSNHAGLSP